MPKTLPFPDKTKPFPNRQVKRTADYVIALSASRDQLSRPRVWRNRPKPAEPLGNMLQRLALRRPQVVLVLENLVADILARTERDDHLNESA